jgi:hypothetical protein
MRKRKHEPVSEAEAAEMAQDVRDAFRGDPEALLAALAVPDELDDEDLERQERAIRRVRRRRSVNRRLEAGFAMMNGEYVEDGEDVE